VCQRFAVAAPLAPQELFGLVDKLMHNLGRGTITGWCGQDDLPRRTQAQQY